MNSALFLLRRSPTEAIFLERRTQFETQFLSTYFGNGIKVNGKKVERWFFAIYYSLKEIVMSCYVRYTGGLRFTFQGSGYSEAFNANFKLTVIQLGVRFSQIPLEMQRQVATSRKVRDVGQQQCCMITRKRECNIGRWCRL